METVTQALHRLTSYEPGREWTDPIDDPLIRQDVEVNDMTRMPWFAKRYAASLPRIALPTELPTTGASALDVLAGTADVTQQPLDLGQLGRLLHLSAGVVRTQQRPYGTYPFRAAGSAGGRFPLELYVAVPASGVLPAGVHWYDPHEHSLVRIGPPPSGPEPSPAASVVVTGVPWRTGWRYRERGYRHLYWDAGSMLTQTLALADAAGLGAQLFTTFPDGAVTSLVGADGVHEFPLAVVALGAGLPALTAAGPAATGRVDAAPIELPLITSAQRAGDRTELGRAWTRGDAVAVGANDVGSVDRVVLARGSQRLMNPDATLGAGLLHLSMSVAMRGIDVPHFVVVHAVDGIEPGVYRWPDLARPCRVGALREATYVASLDQGLARDAAFVVIGAVDVATLDDHQYREAQLAAGIVGGRLHLLAYGLGASASGMTFLDRAMASLLGAALDGLLWTCVGVPAYRSATGGPPRRPTPVRKVAER